MMLNWTDWLIVAILVISSLISLKRGFVKEALSLAIWLIAFVLASWFSYKLAPLLTPYLSEPSLRQMAAFAGIFIATLILGSVANYFLAALIKFTGLGGTDRLLGMLFGLIRGLIVIMVIVLYLPKLVTVDQDSWWQQSVLIPHLQGFEDSFKQLTGSVYDQVIHQVPSDAIPGNNVPSHKAP